MLSNLSFTKVLCMVIFKQSLTFPHKLYVSSVHSIVISALLFRACHLKSDSLGEHLQLPN